MSDSVLVIGGGIAGIQASLDLAHAGARVFLVEREPTIGGKMAVLDKNFPTLDCSICIEAPKMSEVDLHPNIEILSLAELERVEGGPGAFRVHVRQKARFVTDECTRCGDCTNACPVVLPNEFDSGMAARKAIYTPIPQAVPGAYVIDMARCLNDPPNYIPCNRCYEVCPPKCIDFLMPEERQVTLDVGSIILAVGYDTLDPRLLREYGYGSHPDILTALEFERLINSAGPTGGEIIRPSDGEHPESVLFVLCVGSRDRRFFRYCSRFCCMYSIKHAYQALDHGVKDVTVLYMDVRAYGKGFDGFWARTQEAGARFLRGRPSRVEHNGNRQIRVLYEDTERGARLAEQYDMVVLATAVSPPEGLPELAERLGVELDGDGFVRPLETRGGLVMTTRPGVYAAGCVAGPKDIPDSVSEGSGAAALAVSHLTRRHWPEPPEVEPMEGVETPRVGVFVCHCGSNVAGVVDVREVVEFAKTLPDVVYATDQMFSCAGNTQKEIEEVIRREGITRVVVAACSPKTHESIFRGVLVRSGLNPYLLEMANIRNMDSWVHKSDHAAATYKAMDMVWMAAEKARRLVPLEITHLPLTQSALVIGGGIAGMTAAAALARQGFETHLVEKNEHLGGLLTQLDHIAPAGIQARDLVEAQARALIQAGVHVHTGTTVETIGGVVGSFHARLKGGEELQVGAIVMATGAVPYQPTEFGYGSDPRVITNLELDETLGVSLACQPGQAETLRVSERITFVSCVGSRQERSSTSGGGSSRSIPARAAPVPGTGVPDGVPSGLRRTDCEAQRKGHAADSRAWEPALLPNPGCSRYCCTSMIAQALRLRRMGKKVRVLYKEMRAYGRGAEELYEEAMRAGVQFFRYDPDRPPQEVITFQSIPRPRGTEGGHFPRPGGTEGGYVEFYDHLLRADVRVPTDLLVLVVGLRHGNDGLAEQLKLARSEDGSLMELHPKLGPAETATQGIYLAGTAQGAKDVRESIAQGLAAAAKAGALLARGVIEKEPLTARVSAELCVGCMRCVKVCPYGAIEQIGPVKEGTVRVIEAACMGCGTCAAECNFDAIEMPYFTKEQILAQIDSALADRPGEKCIVFTCNWCSYAGADLAGIEKRQYPPSARIIRTMCSARFEEDFVARAFEKGAGAVLVTGCRLTETGSDCHYNYANRETWKRFNFWQRKYARKGIEPERLQLRWISAAEGKEFAEKIAEMDEVVQKYARTVREPVTVEP